ncbi:MAG: RnfABCDGE type electron transport complex subunit B [Spirochaetales bacterium]|nr:RnfABCDGE type electron transport complex subunit B [Spirochaetales bacterium]
MIDRVLYAFLSVGILGGLLGLALAFAARIFAVKKDKRIEEVEGVLPSINCGACGYPGCSGYAEAIINEDADMTLCSPGGADVATKIGEIMGVEVSVSGEKLVAQIHCRGTNETSLKKYEYKGIEDCNAMHSAFGGDKICPYGCLGLGSCIKVCPVDAIVKTEYGYLDIDKDKCIACGKCIDVCPTGVIKMIPYRAREIVACNSTDKGGAVRKYCSVGCIGCKMCEKKSPEGGFKVDNFLASIDYNAEGSRAEAVEVCPAKCIIDLDVAD